ncbi:hypothetical protein [Povalibacter sp.]|uniref:hypothetical protein n=1 Tax=Povalibacter sp. TaxID=1962978 RepID=UPI002D1FA773|nr:hypothetical protein [Povalibacter sp.]
MHVTLFKGQESIELSRLSTLPEELAKLFKSIGDDAGLLPVENQWRASKFTDGSLRFEVSTHEGVSAKTAAACRRIATSVFEGKPQAAHSAGATEKTFLQYAQVAKKIHPGEAVSVAVLPAKKSPKKPPKPYLVTAEVVERLTESVRQFIEYHGTVLGVIHAFYKEAERPHFDLRDVSRGNIIKCFFPRELYGDVVSALAPRDRRVHVSGMVRANRLSKEIDQIGVERLKLVDSITDEEFEKFFGSAPSMTGSVGAADFVSAIRDDEH